MKELSMNKKCNPTDNFGYSLVEVLIAIFILAIAIVPMVNAFKPALISAGSKERLAVFTNQARSTLNRAVSLDYATLDKHVGNPVNLVSLFGDSSEAAQETFTFEGTSYVPTLSIADYYEDVDGLLEITVTIGEATFKTLKAEY
jgi:prepilin-type N-terminal cleavage/methylation domain-containing protein